MAAVVRSDLTTALQFAAMALVGMVGTAAYWVVFLIMWAQKRWEHAGGADA